MAAGHKLSEKEINSMLEEGNFRDSLSDMVNNPDKYTKDEYYTAFLEVTRRFLTELINNVNYENEIVKRFGEEEGDELIEELATSNSAIDMVFIENAREKDMRVQVMNLMDFVQCQFGAIIDDGESEEEEVPSEEEMRRRLINLLLNKDDDDDDYDEDEDDEE